MLNEVPQHPKGRHARILLSSVFGPYAQDDEFGSRAINPMELYHNQVTRLQGPFSLRMFHRSWGIMMIQQNISAPCTVLDFPTRETFARELQANKYDIVGISSIIVNVRKVAEMCRLVRQFSPQSEIVVGGHVSAIPDIESMLDADHYVKGEGIYWMRRHLGEDPNAPIQHPQIASTVGRRILGLSIPEAKGWTAATLIPSVGCPMGCNFCTTSSFFGGKGKFTNFFETGKELFDVMCKIEAAQKVRSFFVMDENFLLNKKRVLELLDRMREAGKSWELNVFSSANAIRQYTMEQLVELGVSWVWMGLESPKSSYAKLKGTDTRQLTAELQHHGIKVLGSTIVGLEHHTPENIKGEIEHAVSHDTDFHQFMLYTPVPGTPLYSQIKEEGRLLDVDLADIHGQWKFNFKHPAISGDLSKKLLDWAFQRDYERNGPSLYRICRTALEGFKRYKDHPDARVRARFQRDGRTIGTMYSALLWAMEKQMKHTNVPFSGRIRELRADIRRHCGRRNPVSLAVGALMLWTVKREAKRLAAGRTYEPQTFIDRTNWSEA
jgi:B12 binding domain/Radical SAM superfamily